MEKDFDNVNLREAVKLFVAYKQGEKDADNLYDAWKEGMNEPKTEKGRKQVRTILGTFEMFLERSNQIGKKKSKIKL